MAVDEGAVQLRRRRVDMVRKEMGDPTGRKHRETEHSLQEGAKFPRALGSKGGSLIERIMQCLVPNSLVAPSGTVTHIGKAVVAGIPAFFAAILAPKHGRVLLNWPAEGLIAFDLRAFLHR